MSGEGYKSYVQGGPESTYGSAAAAVEKLEIIPSENCDLVPGVIEDPSLSGQRSPRDIIDGVDYYEGNLVTRANYEGKVLRQMLRAVFGSYSCSAVESGVNDHIFVEGSNQYSLTLERRIGDVPGATKCFRPVGVQPTRMVFEIAAGNGAEAMGKFSFSYLAQNQTANEDVTGSLAFPARLPAIFKHTDGVDDGSGDVFPQPEVLGVKITLEAPHTNVEEAFLQNSSLIGRPIPSGPMTCKWEIRQKFLSKTLFEKAAARTVSPLSIVLKHPTTIGSTSRRTHTFQSVEAKLTGYTAPVSGFGRIISTATWDAYRSAGNSDSSILAYIMRNTEATL